MKQSLTSMELLVKQTIEPLRAQTFLNHSAGVTAILQGWMDETKAESEVIKRYLHYKDIHTTKAKVMARLVAGYQAQIICFLDLLFAYKKATMDPGLLDLYEKVIKELEDLILFIQQNLPNYFNVFAKIPTTCLLRYRQELRVRIRIIKQTFSPILSDPKLLPILMTPLCQFTSYNREINPTYAELWYMRDLVKKLTPHYFHSVGDPIDTNLIEFLIIHNFNSTDFIDYCTKGFTTKAEVMETDIQKSTCMSFYLKRLMQMHKIPGMSLVSKMPSVKEEVVNWVREEINFFDKQRYKTEGLINPLPPKGQPAPAVKSKENELIKTSFSVAEIALMIRCLQETKMVQFQDRRSFIKRISENCTSVGTEKKGISWASLDSKYSSVEQDTINSLRLKTRTIIEFMRDLEKKLK